MSDEQRNKQHNVRRAGAKAQKKELHSKERRGLDLQPNRGQNNKAFTGPSAGSHKFNQAQRSLEKRSAHMRMPTEDKTALGLVDEPPLIVGVVGPPGCGKSTLIRSMVKYYASRTIKNLAGPITVVAGRSRRLTFLEVPNTVTAMCDVAKIADLVIVMVDGAFGFEMETFEFLSISQVHGFPKVIGVVSHLDQLKTNKTLKKTKRLLRHRFWHEVADGCKMVCLAPMIHNMYRPSDVLKLHRLLLTTTPKSQQWKATHGCVLLDRFEDITRPQDVEADEKCNRTIAVYGYVRGHALKSSQALHIPGVGDFTPAHMSHQPDPCPAVQHEDKSAGNKLRHLSTKQKKIYAPYCDLGGVVFDDDAVYVYEDPDRQNIERTGDGLRMLRDLQKARAIDDQLPEGTDEDDEAAVAADQRRRPVQFKGDTLEMDFGDEAEDEESSDDDEDKNEEDDSSLGLGSQFDDAADDDEVQPGGSAMTGELAPRHPHGSDSSRLTTRSTRFDWSDPVYQRKLKSFFVTGAWTAREAEDEDEDDGIAGGTDDGETDSKGYESVDEDAEAAAYGTTDSGDDDDNDSTASNVGADGSSGAAAGLKRRRVADTVASRGGRRQQPRPELGAVKSESDNDQKEEDDNVKVSGAGVQQSDAGVQNLLDYFLQRDLPQDSGAADFMAEITGNGDQTAPGGDGLGAAAPPAGGPEDEEAMEARLRAEKGDGAEELDAYVKKKMEKKRAFDREYDGGKHGAEGKNNTTAFYERMLEEQAAKKKSVQDTIAVVGEDIEKRIGLLGYFAGLYVRIVLTDVPVEFIRNFNPATPLFAGGLNAGEDQMGFVQGRIKRHRWYPRILKALDPVCLSLGWRRIQTQPVFAVDDPNGRHRYLKYSPKHMHCLCSFYGPLVPPNTGFIVIPTKEVRTRTFRPTASGFTLGAEGATSIVKKLKLTGVPQKVQKTQCFVKGMFTSDIEAARFVGAKVKAVSGLRGIIKKVEKGERGVVRCSFEDKVLMSDIVFLRTWKNVTPPRYCVDMRNALNPEWEGMRPMAQLRRDLDVPLEQNPDSEYKEIKKRREIDPSAPVQVAVSKTLRQALPFEHKEEYVPLKPEREIVRRAKAASAVAPEPHETRKQVLLDAMEKKNEDMAQHQKGLKANARYKSNLMHKKEMVKMDRKIKEAKKESAKRAEFKSQHKTRAAAGKKR